MLILDLYGSPTCRFLQFVYDATTDMIGGLLINAARGQFNKVVRA